MDFLELQLGVLLVVLAKSVLDGLLQFFLDVGTYVAYLNLGLLRNLVALLHQVATALLGRLRNAETDDLAVVLRRDAHVTVHDGLLNVTNLLAVPGLDGDGTGIGSRHGCYLIQGHPATVGFHLHSVENGHIGTTCTDAVQLIFQEHGCHFHSLFTLLQSFFYVNHIFCVLSFLPQK